MRYQASRILIIAVAWLLPAITHAQEQNQKPREPIPPVTDADRAAAFPAGLEGHAVHDSGFHTLVRFDEIEWRGGTRGGIGIENRTWIGGDIDRLWLRAEAASVDGSLEGAELHALWGRSFSRWWDVVAGVRQDFRPGDPQTWAAIGLQGLAPYWFEIEATAFVGGSGRAQFRIEAEYELFLTNRLVLQPRAEVNVFGTSDPARQLGSGLGGVETGLRMRYEIRPELAPYLGVEWERKLSGTADAAREAGDAVGSTRLVVGLRTWF